MHNQPKYIPLRESDFFSDQRSERPLPEGTVARDQLREDAYFYTGKVGVNEGLVFPMPVTAELMQRGEQRFNVYCTPCHSALGDAQGIVVKRGFRQPTSFNDDRMRNAPVGHFIDVMANGFGAMPDYAAQVSPRDRWAIAAYIRALQLSQHAAVSDIPEQERGKLSQSPAAPHTTGGSEVTPPRQVAAPPERGQTQPQQPQEPRR